MPSPREIIHTAGIGTRVTIRYRISEGYRDALGVLRKVTENQCVVETRNGMHRVDLRQVVAAKVVPATAPRRRVR